MICIDFFLNKFKEVGFNFYMLMLHALYINPEKNNFNLILFVQVENYLKSAKTKIFTLSLKKKFQL